MSRILKNSINQITNKYNMFTHKGIDIVKYNNKSSEVIAHSDGIVVELVAGKKNDRSTKGKETYGNYVKIKHDNGMYTLYAHLKSVYVKKNSKVKRGTVLGVMGNSGNATGVHLHFELRNIDDVRINPTKYLDNDLPNMSTNVNVIYQTYDLQKNKWLPNIVDEDGYAGNLGNPISGIYINLSQDNIKYRVHEYNNKWLPNVINRNNYAGNIGKKIDGLQVSSDKHQISYRVHAIDIGWLPWVDKWDDTNDGYAGIFGYEIDAIQLKIKN